MKGAVIWALGRLLETDLPSLLIKGLPPRFFLRSWLRSLKLTQIEQIEKVYGLMNEPSVLFYSDPEGTSVSTHCIGAFDHWPSASGAGSDLTRTPGEIKHASTLEANLMALLDHTQDAIWSIDEDYCFVAGNAAAIAQFRFAFGTDLKPGMSLLEGLPAAAADWWRSHYNRALGGDRFTVELQPSHPSLPEYVEVSFNPIQQDSSVTGVAIYARDITSRKHTEAALQQAKDQLQAVLDAVPACVSWFSADLKYQGINRQLAATFHLDADDFVGKPLGFMDTSPAFARFVQQFITSPLKSSTVELETEVDGQSRVYLIAAQKYGQDQSAIFIGLDISDRRRMEEALRESQERFALAMQGTNDGLWDWNLRTQEIYFSPRWKEILGYAEAEIGNSPNEWFDRVHPEEIDWLRSQIQAHLNGVTHHLEIEHRMRHHDGTYRWVLSRGLAVRDQAGIAYRMAGSQTDITERKQVEKQLLHDAFFDGLTGLANRALFTDRLSQAIERAKRQPHYRFAVLFLDLDRFKVVNDSLGHSVGDQLLMAIARRLEQCVRTGDTVARLGGDEFTILMDNIQSEADVLHLAERIHQTLLAPFHLAGQEIFTTVSIGITLSDEQAGARGQTDAVGDRPEDLLRNADTAMYRAKALGRARHELFDSAMYAHAQTLLQLETDLRRIIVPQNSSNFAQEFQLHYQPIVALQTGKIIGFEALVRWHHPEQGFIAPGQFIPIAEDTGLIIPLGRWILAQACHQLRQWQDRFPEHLPLSISVNLSTRQFCQPDLIPQIRQILEETQLQTNGALKLNLKLEITESAIMHNTASATVMMEQLKQLGVELLIDDFGTGYSSLSYLQRFPIDMVKIDQSFVSRLGVDEESGAIVRAIVTLAHNLEMSVIAEGVETVQQLNYLRSLQTEYAQGFFFARPLTSEGITELLATQTTFQ